MKYKAELPEMCLQTRDVEKQGCREVVFIMCSAPGAKQDCSSKDIGYSYQDISKYIFTSYKVFTDLGYMLEGSRANMRHSPFPKTDC